jgi:hypothetical protein
VQRLGLGLGSALGLGSGSGLGLADHTLCCCEARRDKDGDERSDDGCVGSNKLSLSERSDERGDDPGVDPGVVDHREEEEESRSDTRREPSWPLPWPLPAPDASVSPGLAGSRDHTLLMLATILLPPSHARM